MITTTLICLSLLVATRQPVDKVDQEKILNIQDLKEQFVKLKQECEDFKNERIKLATLIKLDKEVYLKWMNIVAKMCDILSGQMAQSHIKMLINQVIITAESNQLIPQESLKAMQDCTEIIQDDMNIIKLLLEEIFAPITYKAFESLKIIDIKIIGNGESILDVNKNKLNSLLTTFFELYGTIIFLLIDALFKHVSETNPFEHKIREDYPPIVINIAESLIAVMQLCCKKAQWEQNKKNLPDKYHFMRTIISKITFEESGEKVKLEKKVEAINKKIASLKNRYRYQKLLPLIPLGLLAGYLGSQCYKYRSEELKHCLKITLTNLLTSSAIKITFGLMVAAVTPMLQRWWQQLTNYKDQWDRWRKKTTALPNNSSE